MSNAMDVPMLLRVNVSGQWAVYRLRPKNVFGLTLHNETSNSNRTHNELSWVSIPIRRLRFNRNRVGERKAIIDFGPSRFGA